jgi:hypothetical protein
MKNNKEANPEQDHHIARIFSQSLFKYFNVLLFFTVLIILLLGFLFVLKPKYDTITENIQKSNLALEDELANLNFNKAILEGYKNNYKKLGVSSKDRLDQFLPSQFDRDLLFPQMEATIKGQGYVLDSIKLTDKSAPAEETTRGRTAAAAPVFAPPAGVGVYEVDLEISGIDYVGIKHLLSILEKSIKLYDVVGLNFGSEGGSLSLKIYTYYLL